MHCNWIPLPLKEAPVDIDPLIIICLKEPNL